MPTNNYLYPITYNCQFNDSYTRSRLLIPRTECIPMDLTCLWVGDPENSYNCTRCGADIALSVPYKYGDLIHFQTQLPDRINPDPTNPIYGFQGDTFPAAFRVQLLDESGSVISSDVTAFSSDYMVAYGGGISYQMFVVDTQIIKDTFGLSCWSIRVNSFVDTGGGPIESRVVWSEPFKEEICNTSDLVTVKGVHDTFDCCGNYYGLPNRLGPVSYAFVGSGLFTFDNTMSYYAKLMDSGSTVTKTSFQNNVTNSDVSFLFELQLTRPIAPYMHKIFSGQHYGAKEVYIDGVRYNATGSIDNRLDRSTRMFLFDVEFSQDCNLDFNCE